MPQIRSTSSPSFDSGEGATPNYRRYISLGVIAVVLLVSLIVFFANFGYVMYRIESNQVGVKFRSNAPYELVGPGIWTTIGLWESITPMKISGIPFQAYDPEVLTSDKQRIGVKVSGTVHRPGLEKSKEVTEHLWATWAAFYTSDEALYVPAKLDGNNKITVPAGGLLPGLGQQAMKVCVGSLTFDNAVIGTGRDNLRDCIDTELDKITKGYGLEVRNIVVPDVELSPEVRINLDSITDSRLKTDLAQQQEKQKVAEADRQAAEERGKIRVEQARNQETASQQKNTFDLQRQAAEAQSKTIAASKDNEKLEADRNLQIATVKLERARLDAQADLANEIAKARLYGDNATYVQLLEIQAIAAAYKSTDKVFYIPAGTNPLLFLGTGSDTGKITIPIPTPR